LGDYVHEIILKIFGNARDKRCPDEREKKQDYPLDKFRPFNFFGPACVFINEEPEYLRVQKRKYLVYCCQSKGAKKQLFILPKVLPDEFHGFVNKILPEIGSIANFL